ncbi:MAG: hypothetical protein FJ267_06485, partial [Planctomycetes bacterium]|nr:hypothetical protein [Planctomycetota bacterium]
MNDLFSPSCSVLGCPTCLNRTVLNHATSQGRRYWFELTSRTSISIPPHGGAGWEGGQTRNQASLVHLDSSPAFPIEGRENEIRCRGVASIQVLKSLCCWFLLAVCCAWSGDVSQAADKVDFNRDIKPILSNKCFLCHGPDAKERKGRVDGLRLDSEEGATADQGGTRAVVKGNPEQSELIRRI